MANSHQNQFKLLPRTWQKWLVENVERGCTIEGMCTVLTEEGGSLPELAIAAITEVLEQEKTLCPRPDIDTQKNIIQILEQRIEITLTLDKPRIVVLRNVLTHEECDALVALASQRQQRSTVVGTSDGDLQIHADRTSYGATFQREENKLLSRIEARLACLCHWPADHGEGIQVLNYGLKDEYKPHFDWFDLNQPGSKKHMEHGGQRVGTIILYLNELEAGGGTSFPEVGLEVRPQKGGAVFFADIDEVGAPDRQTLHAGMPIMQGTKIIATKWLRESLY